MWYNRLIEDLLKEGYRNDPCCHCIYMKILENEFAIIIIYVHGINIVEHLISSSISLSLSDQINAT